MQTLSTNLLRSGQRARNNQILVLDDDPHFRSILKAMLDAVGYETVEAKDTHIAAAYLYTSTPALAIVDYRLPGVDGINWIKAIRDRGMRFPIILCTGAGIDRRTFEWLRNMAQVSLVVQKPISPESFLNAVESMVPIEKPPVPLGGHEDDARTFRNAQVAIAGVTEELIHDLPMIWQELVYLAQSAARSEKAVEWREAAMAAHRLKGTSGTLGLSQLSAVCARLEESFDSFNPRFQPILAQDIERSLIQGTAIVESLMEKQS